MSFISTPNGIKVAVEFTIGTIVVVITFHFSKAGTIGTTELQDIADNVDDWVHDTLMPLLHNSITYLKTTATDITSSTGQTVTSIVNTGDTGGVTTTGGPNQVALAITRATALRGRSYRGRIFIPVLTNASLDSSRTFSPTAVANFVAALGVLQASSAALGFIESVKSLRNNNANRSSGVLTPITEYRADTRVDTQRRRLD